MPGGSNSFAIGSQTWPGLSKLTEELGEAGQVIGKILAFPEIHEQHPDGTWLTDRLESELGDLSAAIAYVIDHNFLIRQEAVSEQAMKKLALFEKWHEEERAKTA